MLIDAVLIGLNISKSFQIYGDFNKIGVIHINTATSERLDMNDDHNNRRIPLNLMSGISCSRNRIRICIRISTNYSRPSPKRDTVNLANTMTAF